MNVGELKVLLADVSDETPVKVGFEMFGTADACLEASGVRYDIFWVMAED